VSSTFTVDAASNHLTSVAGGLGRTYAYDSAGNTTSYGGTTFTYNAAGRMVLASNSAGTTAYVYNVLGQRIRKSSAASATIFAYDEAGHVIGEYDSSGNLIQEIVWLGDTPVATVRLETCGLSIFYIHTDHLNTPRKISRRSTAELVWSWESDPFGTTVPNESPSGLGQFTFNLRFPGQYYDQETGLSYNGARDFDAGAGKYIESDPTGLEAGINTYSYAATNPVSLVDPSGRNVTMVCRPLSLVGKIGGSLPVHCGVIVWHWSTDCPPKKIVDRQFSLPGFGQRPTIDPNNPTYRDDRNAFTNPGPNDLNYNIDIPAGMSQAQFDAAVIDSGKGYVLPGPYSLQGPNSNTAANDIIRGAGGVPPSVLTAPGQDYSTNWLLQHLRP
jgi:RHS repeat-associated protein